MSATAGRRTMHRYRLDTGALTESLGNGPEDLAITVLQPMLQSGARIVAGAEGWTAEANIQGKVLAVEVSSSAGPLARVRVVLDGRDLSHVVPGPLVLDLPTPVCIVDVVGRVSADPLAGSLGTFVEIISWAWLLRLRGSAA